MQEYNIIVKTMMTELSDIRVKSVMQKLAEYMMGRIVAVEVDTDNMMQKMPKEDRLSYKVVTIKHTRVAIQGLFETFV